MFELRCVIRDKDGNQCPTVIEVSEPVAEKVSFMCRLHTDSVMRKAAGNVKLPRPEVHFQEAQFDSDLKRGSAATGTDHIITAKDRVNSSNQKAPLRAYKKDIDLEDLDDE